MKPIALPYLVLVLGLAVAGARAQSTPASPAPAQAVSSTVTLNIDDLAIHDPFIFADEKTKTYIIYRGFSPGGRGRGAGGPRRGSDVATTASQIGRGGNRAPARRGAAAQAAGARRGAGMGQVAARRAGVQAYVSKDLLTWTGPQVVFEMPEDFWCDANSGPWAPEVHIYNDKYYLFTTFNATSQSWGSRNGDGPPMNKRASQILVGDSPLGPFKPFFNHPTTLEGQMTLDATLYVEDGQPWIVYCHEWVQIEHGTIEALRLKPDLSETVGEPITILNAADFDWTARTLDYRGVWPGRVTDGPQFHRMKNGTLAMIWSSHSENNLYAESVAYSRSGKIDGPWEHAARPLLWDDRGHGMLFRDFSGRLLLAIHRYFRAPATRVQIWEVNDSGETLKIGNQLLGAL